MDAFVDAVERALAAHARLIEENRREISEGLNTLARNILEQSRRSMAQGRALQTLIGMIALQQPDALEFLDRLRRVAQDPLGDDLEAVDQEMERLLTKIQAGVIAAQQQGPTA